MGALRLLGMNILLILLLIALVGLVVFSLVRGIVAFMQTTKIDLENGGDNMREMQERQNKMMFNRIKYQALAVLVVVVLLLVNR